MNKRFNVKSLVALALALAMVVTALPVNGIARVAKAADDTVSVLRLTNKADSSYKLFTIDANEYNYYTNVVGNFNADGEAWKAPATGTQVYRILNPNTGDHVYTTDANEFNYYKANPGIGLVAEGPTFFSADAATGVPVYRLLNPNGNHLFTTDENEKNVLVAGGYTLEGVGFYAVKEDPATLVKLTDAKQTSATSIKIAFDTIATGLVTKDSIKIEKTDDNLVMAMSLSSW